MNQGLARRSLLDVGASVGAAPVRAGSGLHCAIGWPGDSPPRVVAGATGASPFARGQRGHHESSGIPRKPSTSSTPSPFLDLHDLPGSPRIVDRPMVGMHLASRAIEAPRASYAVNAPQPECRPARRRSRSRPRWPGLLDASQTAWGGRSGVGSCARRSPRSPGSSSPPPSASGPRLRG